MKKIKFLKSGIACLALSCLYACCNLYRAAGLEDIPGVIFKGNYMGFSYYDVSNVQQIDFLEKLPERYYARDIGLYCDCSNSKELMRYKFFVHGGWISLSVLRRNNLRVQDIIAENKNAGRRNLIRHQHDRYYRRLLQTNKKNNTNTIIKVQPTFEVENGMSGMNRDVILQLVRLLDNDRRKTRSIFGMSDKHYAWKGHVYFTENRIDVKVVKVGIIYRIVSGCLKSIENFVFTDILEPSSVDEVAAVEQANTLIHNVIDLYVNQKTGDNTYLRAREKAKEEKGHSALFDKYFDNFSVDLSASLKNFTIVHLEAILELSSKASDAVLSAEDLCDAKNFELCDGASGDDDDEIDDEVSDVADNDEFEDGEVLYFGKKIY
ncbi:hypothetical protein FACS189465_0950 [Clostridia bacterium]|nr:hypothetical protein FACS189465_0950 [Clostridia bacterium]